MTVFKNYFKIVKQFLLIIIMYLIIFTFFAIVSTTSSNEEGYFSSAKPNIAVINNDIESDILKAFTDYIKENAEIKSIENDETVIKDALFYREVDYILIIPKGFTSDFMNGLEPEIETMKVPDSYSATYTEMLLNRFLNVSNVYVKSGMSQQQISQSIVNDLSVDTNVTMIESNQSDLEKVGYFYNFLNYIILAVCILIVATIMASFNNKDIKKRNLVSKRSYKRINLELFLGNVCFVFLLWIIYVILSVILYGKTMFTVNGILIILNWFVFCITALSIGFLIGTVVKNKEAQNGIVNVVALGSSFLCGAFVPQQYLGEVVLTIAKFLPSYWFIKNNNDIILLSNFDFAILKPIFINMLIVLAFGIFFFILTNIISKLTLKKN